MYSLVRTDSQNPGFKKLVSLLDAELAITDGKEHAFYDQFNKIDSIKYVVLAFQGEKAIGCGAIKEFDSRTMEVKRMYVVKSDRGKGVASMILEVLENWSKEMSYSKCILETGVRQPDAIALYKKNDYLLRQNYGQYIGVENSLCFEKSL
ncbi:GNAT family N-acetyltransferase [Aquiflexum sp.]|uniref:GNAT family N-acetyltransferase n=1 Tax=Aquiflexum sp. TaxID=1872584 RepID=UPI00359329EA